MTVANHDGVFTVVFIFQVPVHHFAEHCHRRLDRTMQSGAKRGVRKPTMDEIDQAKVNMCDMLILLDPFYMVKYLQASIYQTLDILVLKLSHILL